MDPINNSYTTMRARLLYFTFRFWPLSSILLARGGLAGHKYNNTLKVNVVIGLDWSSHKTWEIARAHLLVHTTYASSLFTNSSSSMQRLEQQSDLRGSSRCLPGASIPKFPVSGP